jgi:hypothetical protein
MKNVRQWTTPEIDQAIQRLKELRENHARYILVPKLNELQAEYDQTKRLMDAERHRLASRKPPLSPIIQAWFQEYSETHKGRRIRWTDGEWTIVTHTDRHTGLVVHTAVNIKGGVHKLGSGILTKGQIEEFAKQAQWQRIHPYEKVG